MARTFTDGFGNPMPYACTPEGRLLLALRAGAVETDALAERFGRKILGEGMRNLLARGLVKREPMARQGHLYSLTAEGRRKCPKYRDLETQH